MSRNKINTVEYFPHIAKSGKTLFILEGKHGNDGYAFWFKLLEILAASENHFYNAANETDWQYLVARARITDDSATEMLSLLANLGNIDANLWQNEKIIWCQALVDNLSEVYRRRKRVLPEKPLISVFEKKADNCGRKAVKCDRNATKGVHSAAEITQSRVEESRVKESKVDKNPCVFPKTKNTYEDDFETWWKEYPQHRRKDKQAAYRKWKTHKKNFPPIQEMIATLKAQKETHDWLKDGGQYVPLPETYLNKGRYVDESVVKPNQPVVSPGIGTPTYAADPNCKICGGKGFAMKPGEGLQFQPCPEMCWKRNEADIPI